MEACNDGPHNKLLEEVMKKSKEQLEQDIKVKKNSLLIDQQKCMTKRRTFPFNVGLLVRP